MNLFGKYESKPGFTSLIKPGEKGMNLIDFGILNLKQGQNFRQNTEANEVVLVIFSGKCNVTCGPHKWENIGERRNVFAGNPYSVYIPSDSEYEITGVSEVEIGICKAPADSQREARLIKPEDGNGFSRGRDNWRRDVYEIACLGQDSEALIIGETTTGAGNWSSYPPHKHDLEEAYFFKSNPRQGVGIQRVYTDDRQLDELYTIEDDTYVAIPEGYHPLVAAPGYKIWFLYVLAAGKGQFLEAYNDPEHDWLG